MYIHVHTCDTDYITIAMLVFPVHFKRELLTQFPALNDEKYMWYLPAAFSQLFMTSFKISF